MLPVGGSGSVTLISIFHSSGFCRYSLTFPLLHFGCFPYFAAQILMYLTDEIIFAFYFQFVYTEFVRATRQTTARARVI